MRIGHATLTVAFALSLFAWSLSAGAQQPTKVPHIGILSDESPVLAAKSLQPFAQGLRDLGYIEGQNIAFERRYAEETTDILPSLAAELVSLQPDVILAVGTPAAEAAKTATQTIPIVFTRAGDPIGSGLVSSLARPGGNLTGVSVQMRELAAKRLEFLITAVPGAKSVGVLWDPSFPPASPQLREIEGAARSLNREVVPVEVRVPDDFEPVVEALMARGARALIVVPSTIFSEHLQRLTDLAAKARLPAMFPRREFVQAGGLMSYGPTDTYKFRRAAALVDKILKGAKPSDIPVEQPTRFELVINLKTAKALSLTIPYTFLGRADEVIE
jgi:putative tryptophan/tyrosine transport system substrate-binding protein